MGGWHGGLYRVCRDQVQQYNNNNNNNQQTNKSPTNPKRTSHQPSKIFHPQASGKSIAAGQRGAILQEGSRGEGTRGAWTVTNLHMTANFSGPANPHPQFFAGDPAGDLLGVAGVFAGALPCSSGSDQASMVLSAASRTLRWRVSCDEPHLLWPSRLLFSLCSASLLPATSPLSWVLGAVLLKIGTRPPRVFQGCKGAKVSSNLTNTGVRLCLQRLSRSILEARHAGSEGAGLGPRALEVLEEGPQRARRGK